MTVKSILQNLIDEVKAFYLPLTLKKRTNIIDNW